MPVDLDFSTLDLVDALDLAIMIEIEALERYKVFAEQIGHRESGDAASIFQSMATNEEKHGRQLIHRRQELFGDAPPRISRSAIFDVEAPEVGAPRLEHVSAEGISAGAVFGGKGLLVLRRGPQARDGSRRTRAVHGAPRRGDRARAHGEGRDRERSPRARTSDIENQDDWYE